MSALAIWFFLLVLDSEGKSNLGPIAVILFCLLCGGYYELWIFDRKLGKIEQQSGFFLFFKRKTFLIKELKYLQISSFVKGEAGITAGVGIAKTGRKFWQKRYLKLTLVTHTNRSYQIEMVGQGGYDKLEQKGKLISQLCGVELISLV